MRTCIICQQEKKSMDFYRDTRGKRAARCKVCHMASQKKPDNSVYLQSRKDYNQYAH